MRRTLTTLLATLIVPFLPAPAGALEEGPKDDGAQECAEPAVTRTYTADAMTMTLDVDLRGCDWWDGSPLALAGFVGRDDGEDPEDGDFALGLNACSAVENEGYADGTEARFDKVGCAIEVIVEHPNPEVAYYYGGISYLWEDGPREIDLDTTCLSSPAGAYCRDGYAPAVRGPGIRT